MHPQIERFEQLFAQGKHDPAALSKFFDELWLATDSLPRAELRKLIDEVVEWARLQVSIQPDILAVATFASGCAAFYESNFESSLLTLSEARRMFDEVKDRDGAMAAITMIGCNYRSMGEMELALKCLLDAYQNLSATGRFKIFRSYCLYQLAEIYSETKQYNEALRFHQLCEKFVSAKETESKNMLSRALNGMGVVYQHQKKYSLALEYLSRSLKLTEELKNSSTKARVLTDLGFYYTEMGDWATATDYQQQALSIRNEMNIQGGAVTNMILLAEIAIKSGRQDEAIDWLSKALKIAEEIKVKQKMFQIHLMLSEIYQTKGDLIRSLFHYKAYHSIREEVQHEDNEKKIKNLQLIFEAEQTQKENVIIKAQKVEIENKNQQLQETIDELTITRVSRKAKVLTLIVGITLIVAEDPIFNVVLERIGENNYWPSIVAKVVIILSLKPIDKGIENYLLRRIILKKKKEHALLHKGK